MVTDLYGEDMSADGIPVVKGVLVPDAREGENGTSDGVFDGEESEYETARGETAAAAVISNEVEAHTVLSACVLVCAIGCDALTALDVPKDIVDAPSSLRVSSLVAVGIFASPVIRGISLVDQRVITGALLGTLALLGVHEAGEDVRTGDCIYTTFVLVAMIQIYKSGGIETESVRPDSVHDKPHRRQTVSGLCAGLMCYSGLRGLRAAFVSSRVSADYNVDYLTPSGTVTSVGYSHSSTATSIPLGFGHGVILGTGILIGFHDEARVTGSSAVAFEVGAAGIVACVAALWALLGYSQSVEYIQVLYGPGACKSDTDVCYEAARARRTIIVNSSSSSLWMSGLSALVFSFAVEKRFLNSAQTAAESMWARRGLGVSLALAFAALVGVYDYSVFEGDGWHTEVCTLLCIVGVFVSSMADTLIGTLLYASAMTYEQYKLLQTYGASMVFNHLTHCTLFLTLVLMWVQVGLILFKDSLQLVLGPMRYLTDSSIVNKSMGVVSTAGTSLAFGLYMASAILLAASNGNLPQEDDLFRGGSPRRSIVAFALDHFLPFFIWMPLYACRCEVNLISSWTRATTWLVAVPVDAVVYMIILAYMGQAAPTVSLMQMAGATAVGIGNVVAWVVGAFV
jgi:hypothetical protein